MSSSIQLFRATQCMRQREFNLKSQSADSNQSISSEKASYLRLAGLAEEIFKKYSARVRVGQKIACPNEFISAIGDTLCLYAEKRGQIFRLNCTKVTSITREDSASASLESKQFPFYTIALSSESSGVSCSYSTAFNREGIEKIAGNQIGISGFAPPQKILAKLKFFI